MELKGIQVCANCYIRGIYTSDNIYHVENIPREMDFKRFKNRPWGDTYDFRYIPNEISMIQAGLTFEVETKKKYVKLTEGKDKHKRMRYDLAQYQDDNDNDGEALVSEKMDQFIEGSIPDEKDLEDRQKMKTSPLIPFQKKNKEEKMGGLPPQDLIVPKNIMNLKHIIGFTAKSCPDIKWSKSDEHTQYFASGNVIIQTTTEGVFQQQFFKGHTNMISCQDISADGKILASCQEGDCPSLRVFNTETKEMMTKADIFLQEVRCLSLSYDGQYIAVIGSDKMMRDEILILQMEQDATTQKYQLVKVARQVSEFNILTIKFSPVELDKQVSCGKENIRFWRIKNEHCPGGAVILNHHARNTVFTVLDFDFGHNTEPNLSIRNDKIKRVFVGSKHGYLYQVNYDTRVLEAVFKIHDYSICSIAISSGFCVTGSQDQYLRVWPLDFSEFYLEAYHEGVIISLDISYDSQKVACGTSNGSLSILDLNSQSYRTLLRSHTNEIMSLTYQPCTNYLISLSKDGSIRVWNGANYEQTYEFNYLLDDACTCICASTIPNIFIGGFMSGIIRVFDVQKIAVVNENRYHDCPIQDIKISPNGIYCGLGDKKGFYSQLECANNFQFVKTFEGEVGTSKISCEFSPDNKYFATIGGLASCVNIWSLTSLNRVYKIATHNSFIHSIKFSNHDKYEQIVLTCDSKVKFYSMNGDIANLRGEIPFSHSGFLSSVNITKNHKYVITTGGDKQVKVWDYLLRATTGPGSHQKINGHASPIYCSAISADSKTIFTAGGYEGIYIWDFKGDVDTEFDQEQVADFLGWNQQSRIESGENTFMEESKEVKGNLPNPEPHNQYNNFLGDSDQEYDKAGSKGPTSKSIKILNTIASRFNVRFYSINEYNEEDMRLAYSLFNWALPNENGNELHHDHEDPDYCDNVNKKKGGFTIEDVNRIHTLIDWNKKECHDKERDITKLTNQISTLDKFPDDIKKERCDMIYDIFRWNRRVIGFYKESDNQKIWENYNFMKLLWEDEIVAKAPADNHQAYITDDLDFDPDNEIAVIKETKKGGLEDALRVFYGEVEGGDDDMATKYADYKVFSNF